MSAAHATSTSAQIEPSMEEILASIRRIIADDHAAPGRADEAGFRPAPVAVLEPRLRSVPAGRPESKKADSDAEHETEAKPGDRFSSEGDDGLASPEAGEIVAAHFRALAAGAMINEAKVIERYAEDILRPLLKQWVDDHLPGMVERMVRAEIERLARGRR